MSYDTQPFYAPWAFKEVEPGEWRVREATEVPTWSEASRRLRRKLWQEHHTHSAQFVLMMHRNYGHGRADRILNYLLARYKEHLEMAKPDAEPRPPRLWDFEHDREMSPGDKLQLWMKVQGGAAGAASPGE